MGDRGVAGDDEIEALDDRSRIEKCAVTVVIVAEAFNPHPWGDVAQLFDALPLLQRDQSHASKSGYSLKFKQREGPSDMHSLFAALPNDPNLEPVFTKS